MRAWMLSLFLACACNSASAKEFSAMVIAVLDGDTVLVKRGGGLVKIRLAEIDAPEVGHAGMGGQPPNSQKAQPFGETSKHSLSDMVLGKQVKVVSQATDQYGRMVAHISIDSLDVNAEQIRLGMAWEYSNFHSNQTLIALQEEAKQVPRGLWALSSPTPPWDWRKQHPAAYADKTGAGATSANVKTAATILDPTCGDKKHCSQILSCGEAEHDFSKCGVKALDGDSDGTPCESLCAKKNKSH